MSNRDLDFMEHADGEAETDLTAEGRAKVDALHELGELVRGRLELAADDVPDARFASMWREIDKQIDLKKVEKTDVATELSAHEKKLVAACDAYNKLFPGNN